ncbi:placental protein 11 [Trichinella spiralis]|uniref:placental protein 11 n=1 Tax=Trichinella spiralis TaxID=6334 RepID=UPI0001EFBA7D|nr:placental protein 11 [Trichinella spiralis]
MKVRIGNSFECFFCFCVPVERLKAKSHVGFHFFDNIQLANIKSQISKLNYTGEACWRNDTQSIVQFWLFSSLAFSELEKKTVASYGESDKAKLWHLFASSNVW